ncbi:hypothetical protein PAEVO_29030 [Paenibacillus sp. GM2FR]|uniref:collagen-like repeat preface domain-containing protein n=1 Tax=Paenibacillus sp. GM2FR TaxID=2059268 RepID=UPI000C27DAC5|nr:collagen-like repeat preface domain-containing protein [Paenibacillus sp. GM2FR]PJN56180.1 hypothetical protein PAEVO_29030 [Paenibacillus sp. GM2FR]
MRQERRKRRDSKAVIQGLTPGRIRVGKNQATRFVTLIRQLTSRLRAFVEQPVNENFTLIKIQLQSLNDLVSGMRFSLRERRGLRLVVQQIARISNADNLEGILTRLNEVLTLIQSYGERIGVGSEIGPDIAASQHEIQSCIESIQSMEAAPPVNNMDNIPLYIMDATTKPGVGSRQRLAEVFQGINEQASRSVSSEQQLERLQAADGMNALLSNGASTATGSIGVTGAAGTTGPTGLGGLPGATGPKGAREVAGPTSPEGAPGVPGGISGATGPTGETGATEAIGETVATGDAGIRAAGATSVTGATGKTGPVGPPGAMAAGATGEAGVTGVTGVTGVLGATGATGVTRRTGVAGTTEEAGATGVTGAPGPTEATEEVGAATDVTAETGAAAATGAAGGTGSTGRTGSTGVIGLTRVTGEIAVTGATGATGAARAIGPTGSTGPTGPMVVTGLAGASGPAGPTVPTGPVLVGGSVIYASNGTAQKVATNSPVTFSTSTLQGVTFNGATTLTIVTAGFYYFDWQISLETGSTAPNAFGIVVNGNTTNAANMNSNSTNAEVSGSAVINLSAGNTVGLYNLSPTTKSITALQTGARISIFRIGS